MRIPAITVIHLQDGRAVQTAGLDIPVEQQIETLAEAGRLNQSPVPGAIRGEVWTADRIRARTFFEPTAAPAPADEARISEALGLIRRLEQLEKEGLTQEQLFAATRQADEAAAASGESEDAAAAAIRKVAEDAAAAEAARKAEAEAASTPSQGTAPGADETHNLDEAGSTPAPATNPPAGSTTDGAEDPAPAAPAPSAPRGRLRPPTGA